VGSRRVAMTVSALLAAGLIALAAVTVAYHPVIAAMRDRGATTPVTMFGPLDAEGAYSALRRSLAHGSLVLAVVLVLVRIVPRGRCPALAAALALIVMTADLALANAPLVLTVPQALLDARPEVVRIIDEAERRAGPLPDPFRVHRMALWYPPLWDHVASDARIIEFDRWERDTIRPKFGLLHGIEYTLSSGVAEIDDYAEFFGGFRRSADAATAGRLGLAPGQPLIVFPRRSFDMWNTRYFVLPANPNGWNDETRAYAAFVTDADRIFPPPAAFEGPGGPELRKRWVECNDFQVFRSRTAHPRSWVVHAARFHAVRFGSDRAARDAVLRSMLDSGSSDPRSTAWLQADSRTELAGYLPGTPPLPSETSVITRYDPQRVEIDVALVRPGLVVLADTYDPGWRLTVDGATAPVHRTNLMMRGAAVSAGRHHLVYRYEPRTWRLGVALSGAGLAALAALGFAFWLRPVR
jgi:Bacterial membrane protein YfhO